MTNELTKPDSQPNPKKGTKYSAEERLRAKELFLRGKGTYAVATQMRRETGRDCNQALIERWRVKGNWDEDRKAVVSLVDTDLVRFVSDDLLERSKSHLTAYKTMTDQGSEALRKKMVNPESSRDAVDMVDKGIKGERMVTSSLISLDLIEQLAKIVFDEVADEEIRRRIAARFSKYAIEMMKL